MTATGRARPAFSFMVCPDSGILLEELDSWLQKWPPDSGRWKRHVFWGDEAPDQKFWGALGQAGLFVEHRAVIVRNAQDWPISVWKELSRMLGNELPGIWPFFCLEVEMEKGRHKIPAAIQKTPCMIFADKMGWVWRNPGLSQMNLKNLVIARAKKLHVNLVGQALEVFCASVKPDSRAIGNELEKLALLGKNVPITVDMISRDSSSPETDAFLCIKKLENGDLPGAWLEMARGTPSSLLFFLIALLAREFRIFWQLNAGDNAKIPPFEFNRKKDLAKKLGSANISRGFCLLTDAEWNVKSGRQTPEQALEFLVSEMAKMFMLSGQQAYK